MGESQTGRRLAAARTLRGFTQEQLAKELGVSAAQVSRVERGEVDPSLGLARRWARACGVPITTITGEVADG